MQYNKDKHFILIQRLSAEAIAPLLLKVREDPGAQARNQPHSALAAQWKMEIQCQKAG